MSREWKPGDVGLLKCTDGQERIAILTDRGPNLSPLWIAGSEHHGRLNEITVRPVVVIDPEDREQVERLEADMAQRAGWIHLANTQRANALQAALRSLIAPPKPEEPTGLGAVVEDAAGNYWTRIYDGEGKGTAWYCDRPRPFDPSDDHQWKHYADISAVRVLSQGVDQ